MTDLEATLATSEEMLQAARAGDWDRVRTLQFVRSRQLGTVFDDLPADGSLAPLLDQVRGLARHNREMVKLAMDRRDEHGERLAVLRAGQRARRAYVDHRSETSARLRA